jgi:hypothetical protein
MTAQKARQRQSAPTATTQQQVPNGKHLATKKSGTLSACRFLRLFKLF